jgi:low temperature requirement protein LtrA
MDVSDQGGVPRAQVGGEQRVTPLELFFDLVFVFALTQVTSFLADHLTWLGMLQAVALLTALWGAWAQEPLAALTHGYFRAVVRPSDKSVQRR